MSQDSSATDMPNDLPTIACTRCNREWALGFELDTLKVGNQAVEQFALDHKRHTGHFPDDIQPWIAACRRCPDGESYLSERPAIRWAKVHARHTGHSVAVDHGERSEPIVVEPGETAAEPDD